MNNIPIGYVYLIKNKHNHKTYVGQRKLSKDRSWRDYMGSGSAIKSAISKYGKNSFTKSLLIYAFDQEDLDKLEIKYINLYGFNNKETSYNLTNVLSGGDTFSKLSKADLDKVKEKQSIGHKNSEKVKSFRRKEKENRIILREKYRNKVLKEYNILLNMKKVAESLGISANLVSEILNESNVAINHQNIKGHKKTGVDIDSNIKRSLKAKSNYYYPDGLNAIEKHDQLLEDSKIFLHMKNKEIQKEFHMSPMAVKTFKIEHGFTQTKRNCYICLSRI